MKSGKNLEEVVHIIQKTLVNDDYTKVFKNKKLKNLSGNKREFDIVIESVINSLQIIIAIECKDYKNAVSVEKIEAFNSKCIRIPEINKKIMISRKGFQKDAISAAENFGIELYNFSDIESSTVNNWIANKFYPIELYIVYDQVEIEFSQTPSIEITSETLFSFQDFPEGICISKFLKCSFEAYDNLKQQYEEFFNSNLSESKKFQLNFTKTDNIKLKDYPNVIINDLNCIFHLKKQEVKATRYEEIKSNSNKLMAKITTYPFNKNLEFKVLSTEKFKNEKLTILVTDKITGNINEITNYNIETVKVKTDTNK